MNQTAERFRTRELVVAALCTAVIAVCAQISIPMPFGVPLTLQTFAVALTGFLLAPKMAMLSVTCYLLLGAAGVPVFSAFSGGASALVGKTGGFLFGFLLLALLASLSRKRVPALALALTGLLLCHLLGVLQFMLLTHTGFVESALLVSVKYLPKDAISVVAAMFLGEYLRHTLQTVGSADRR